ncbi:MAG TPA: hypothetical protein VMV94_04895, partial [Phycisphaerae bacterium]|nr:hypothetical protein [Phycisphaerae bacterium]
MAVQVTPALAPLDKKVTVQPTNTGGGMSCIHLGDSGTVTKHATSNRDHISGVQPTGLTDGTKDGYISVGYRVDHREYYSSGHTGGRGGAGDRPLLTANTYQHAQATLGACCDTSTGACTDTVEQADCLAGGEWMRWFAWETCDELNPLCEAIVGACCVQRTCLRVSPYQCYLAGGEYKGDGSSCDPNPCLCADFFVNAPGSWTGSTCGAGNDCGLRRTEEVIYAVTIPWDGNWIFDLCGSGFDTYMFVGTSCCGAELGYNDDSTQCGLQSWMRFMYLAAGTYYMDIEGYSGCGSYVFNVHEVLGACCGYWGGGCYACLGTMSQAACWAQYGSGSWYAGQDCAATFTCFDCPESEIRVTIMTDSRPSETTWELVQEWTGDVVAHGGPYPGAATTYCDERCVPDSGCYDFAIYDSHGDGIDAPGGYEIRFNGTVVASTLGYGWYGSSVSVTQIGGCVFSGACCFAGPP